MNVKQNRDFFDLHAVTPGLNEIAVDLGAGCGFQSVALASMGFTVYSVDFCQPMLDILACHAGSLPIRIIPSDILAFARWSGLDPELIVCMGDTITHLPDIPAVKALIRQCGSELARGGKIVVSFRDYSYEPDGASVVIPVRRDPDRIFICRLDYGKVSVRVTDILYIRKSGSWLRISGSYTKIRLAPVVLQNLMADAGLSIVQSSMGAGSSAVIAEKS